MEQVTGTSEMFGFFGGDTRFIKREKVSDSLRAAYFSVTPSFIKTMGMKLVAGETLPVSNSEKGTHFVVINEEAVRKLQFKNPFEATGKYIWINDSTYYIVAGVVKDFHYASFSRAIQPLLLTYKPDEFKILNLKIAEGAEQSIIPRLEKTWKKLYPHQPLKQSGLMSNYTSGIYIKMTLCLVGLLTSMSLSIACLGTVRNGNLYNSKPCKRSRIRKVMGAKSGRLSLQYQRIYGTIVVICLTWDCLLAF
ncbi:MAG: ABC transporter permease [Segetibacter sp.]